MITNQTTDASDVADAIADAPMFGACVVYSYALSAANDERHEWTDPALT